MVGRTEQDQTLRSQIERTTAQIYSTEDIEGRIAQALLESGEFDDDVSSDELEVVLRNIVYVMFARQTLAGRELGLLHNVPIMNVEIADGEANVDFVVHIHKPVVVFIEFNYTMINDDDSDEKRLSIKEDSLVVKEKTRRFDVKAKAAMTAMNVPRIARNEMSDLTAVIYQTLPAQLEKKGVRGELDHIDLTLNDKSLHIHLRGDFKPLPPDHFPEASAD